MNSIIWKGVPSTNIKGLLISELPPISAPAMRVKETAIDGRDGSIIEDLGYASYDKPVVIGLYGDFDINQVIKYFTGEGEVVFSNEPDKVYTAKIVGQIDYTRLLRFRQATIPFRVQPFKRKLNEAYKETEIATATGVKVELSDGANALVKGLKIVDSTGSKEKTTVQSVGKNLLQFPYPDTSRTVSGIQFTINDDGSIDVKGTATGFATLLLDKDFEFADGVSYVIGGTTNRTAVFVCYDQANGQRVYATSSFTWSKYNTFIQIYVQVAQGVTVNETIYPMLEISTTQSAFEPYKKSVAEYDYATGMLSNPLQTFAPTTIITNGDNATMTVEYFKHYEVFNEGLEASKPIMVLKGEGIVVISVNGLEIFQYEFPEGENEVVIDSEKEDAYLGDVLKNRNMNGEFPVLLPGTNVIEWSGNVSSIETLPRSRWL